jgi:hypothetical protein
MWKHRLDTACSCEYEWRDEKLKVKVKLSLCLIRHQTMKVYWGVDVLLHAFLTSALDGGDWSASNPRRFNPRERAPGTQWIGGWVCLPQSRSGRCGEEKSEWRDGLRM